MPWTGPDLPGFVIALGMAIRDAGFVSGVDTPLEGPTLARFTIGIRQSATLEDQIGFAEVRRDFSVVVVGNDHRSQRRTYRFRVPAGQTIQAVPLLFSIDIDEIMSAIGTLGPGRRVDSRNSSVGLARHIRDVIRNRGGRAVIGPSVAEVVGDTVIGSRVELSDAVAIDVRPGSVVLEIDGESLTRYPRPDITIAQVTDLVTAAMTTLEDRPNAPRPMTFDHANPDRRTFRDVVDLFRAIRVRLHPEDSRDRFTTPEVDDPMDCTLRIELDTRGDSLADPPMQVVILIGRAGVIVTDANGDRHSFDVTERPLEYRGRLFTRLLCNVLDVVATARALAGLRPLPHGLMRVNLPNLAAISAVGRTPIGRQYVRMAEEQEREEVRRRRLEELGLTEDDVSPDIGRLSAEQAQRIAARVAEDDLIPNGGILNDEQLRTFREVLERPSVVVDEPSPPGELADRLDDALEHQRELNGEPQAETPAPRRPTGESAFGRAVRNRIEREREGE